MKPGRQLKDLGYEHSQESTAKAKLNRSRRKTVGDVGNFSYTPPASNEQKTTYTYKGRKNHGSHYRRATVESVDDSPEENHQNPRPRRATAQSVGDYPGFLPPKRPIYMRPYVESVDDYSDDSEPEGSGSAHTYVQPEHHESHPQRATLEPVGESPNVLAPSNKPKHTDTYVEQEHPNPPSPDRAPGEISVPLPTTETPEPKPRKSVTFFSVVTAHDPLPIQNGNRRDRPTLGHGHSSTTSDNVALDTPHSRYSARSPYKANTKSPMKPMLDENGDLLPRYQ